MATSSSSRRQRVARRAIRIGYRNVVANPDVELEIGTERFNAHATPLAEGAERNRLYGRHADVMPGFHDYELKTNRIIPVVVLERVRPPGRGLVLRSLRPDWPEPREVRSRGFFSPLRRRDRRAAPTPLKVAALGLLALDCLEQCLEVADAEAA